MSRGKYIANLSQHSPSLHNRWLANLVRNFDDPEVAAVYGRQVAEPFSDMIEARYLKAEFGNERKIRTNNFHFSNANCAILKRAWEEEPFDETLTGSEDREWAKRILSKGYKIVYEPDAPVYHSHHRTFLQKYHYARINLLAEMRFFDKREIQSTGELIRQWKWLCIGDQLWVLGNPGHLRWLLFAPIVRFLEAFVYFYFLKWKNNSHELGKS
jgi:rhamnosyltransferase